MKQLLFVFGLLLLWSCRKDDLPVPVQVENGLVFNVPVLSEAYQDGKLVQKITYFQKRLNSIGNTVYLFFPPSVYAITVKTGVREVREYKYDEGGRLLYEEYTRNDVPWYRRNYVYEKKTLVLMKTEAYPGYPYPGETRFNYSSPWAFSVSFLPVVNGELQFAPPDVFVKWKSPFIKEVFNKDMKLSSREVFSVLVKAPDFNICYVPKLEPISDRLNVADLFFNKEAPPVDQDPGLLKVCVEQYDNGTLLSRTSKESIKLNRHGLPDSYEEVKRNASGVVVSVSKWSFLYTAL